MKSENIKETICQRTNDVLKDMTANRPKITVVSVCYNAVKEIER